MERKVSSMFAYHDMKSAIRAQFLQVSLLLDTDAVRVQECHDAPVSDVLLQAQCILRNWNETTLSHILDVFERMMCILDYLGYASRDWRIVRARLSHTVFDGVEGIDGEILCSVLTSWYQVRRAA